MGTVDGETVHKDFDVEDVVTQLSLDEKIALLAGRDMWHTNGVSRLGVPSIRMSDGPNGVRGTKFFNGVPAACLPCGTALASTWDTKLITEGGRLQGREALAKGASVILGPTSNMQRSPLGGRGFESFSEDPLLAGNMAAATINGIQSMGVAATLKHFVCNDGEHRRQLVDAIVTERALREIYLMPFQIAQRDSQPQAFMTAYNRVNGIHLSEHPRILGDVLRKEWGFNGMIMSDWFGVYTTTDSIKAGLDIEMPGPGRVRGQLIRQAMHCGKLIEHDIDQCVYNVLTLVKKTLPLGIGENAPEHTVDSPETAALLRKISADSIVLLKNDHSTLPFKKNKTIAVIGPNAMIAAYCGGGSAVLKPYYAVSPLEGIRRQTADCRYALGCPGWKTLPLLSRLSRAKNGKQGLDIKIFLDPPSNTNRKHIDEIYTDDANIFLVEYKNPQISGPLYYAELDCVFSPEETAEYEFGLTLAGTGKLFVNDELVVDNETEQTPGDSFFGVGTREEAGVIHLEKDKEHRIHIKFGTLPTLKFARPGATPFGAGGLRIGCHRKVDRRIELNAAVALAKEVDQVLICAGLNKEWESEGFDRKDMDLPPGSNELIRAVVAANRNTAVVIQSGTPVTMPWLDDVPTVLQAWYGGNETGNALADVVFGDVNPGGKLSLSFPVRNEDNPAFLNYICEGGRTLYGEDIYIGYRFYQKTKREVNFPFGHGLSYTRFVMSKLSVAQENDDLVARVEVNNTGAVAGAQVVQVYINQQAASISRPPKELKGFAKVYLEPGATETVEVRMIKKYACSYWDEIRDSWIMEKGKYTVLVGDSSVATPLQAEFEISKSTWWRGL